MIYDYMKRPGVGLILSVIIIVISHLFTLYYFPPTEGWWQSYAYLYNNYPEYYKGMHISFPPLFVVYDAALMKLSQYYMTYRLAGLLQVILMFYVLYKSVSRLFKKEIAISSALFAVLMSEFNNAYFPNDYHTTMSLFVVISLLCYQVFLDVRETRFVRYLSACLLSISLFAVFFLKQNIGGVLLFATYAGLIVSAVKRRDFGAYGEVVVYSVFLVISYMLFSNWLGVGLSDIYKLTLGNDSKGSVITVLLRFITDEGTRQYLQNGFGYFLLLLGYIYGKDRYCVGYERYVALLDKGVFLVLVVVFFRDPQGSAVILCVIYMYYMIYKLIIKREYDIMILPLLAIIYANTMTAGLGVGGVFVVMPYAIGFYFKMLDDDKYALYINYGFVLLLFVVLFVYKQQEPYNWWGLKQGEISDAKYSLPYDQLSGFKVDRVTWQMFNDVKTEIDYKSTAKNDVYLFPDIPVFYQLHDKIPPTTNLVQWFDVISTNQVKQELLAIKQVQPKVVIALVPPWFVFKGHAKLKHSKLYQQNIIKYFDSQVEAGVYKMIKYQIYDNEYYGDNANDEDIVSYSVMVNSPKVIGKKIDELYAMGYFKDQYDVYDIISNSRHIKDIEKHRFRYGDKISVHLRYSQVNDFMCKVGVPDLADSDKYVLRIYERSVGE